MKTATAVKERQIRLSPDDIERLRSGLVQIRMAIRCLPARGYFLHTDCGAIGIFDDNGYGLASFWFQNRVMPIAILYVYEIPGNPRGWPHRPGENNGGQWRIECPYGKPGETMAVRGTDVRILVTSVWIERFPKTGPWVWVVSFKRLSAEVCE